MENRVVPATKEIEEKNIELEQKVTDLEKSLNELRDLVNAHRNDAEVNHTEVNVSLESRKFCIALTATSTDQQSIDILMNKMSITRTSATVERTENVVNVISGSNVDELKEVFVTREAPDNAIQRIETLENQVKELMKANMPKIVSGNSDGLAAAKNAKDLQKRLAALEEKSEAHDQSLADLEAALSALKDAA